MDLVTGEFRQYELLLRMRDPLGELISPAAFLPVAERYDLIGAIDRWVVSRSIAMLAEENRARLGSVEFRINAADPKIRVDGAAVTGLVRADFTADEGARFTHRADIFALGTMLYEITTGKQPFARPTTEGILYAIRNEDPSPPHLLRDDYPEGLSRSLMRCLTKDRIQRYQRASAVR